MLPPEKRPGAVFEYRVRHRRLFIAVRILVSLALAGVSLYLADRYGVLRLAIAYPLYTAVIAAIPAVIAVLSLRRRRVTFRVHIPADDPGHMNLPYMPGYKPGPTFRRYRMPLQEIPSTYPAGSIDGYARRWATQWAYQNPDGTPDLRSIELKFASIAVQPLRGDAVGCHANANIIVRSGVDGSYASGAVASVGRLNWYRDGWDEPLLREVMDEKGRSSQPLLDRLNAVPSVGFNEYLSNPEMTINEGEWAVLPLFYMRAREPEVHLCGQKQAQTAGLSRHGEVVEFELQVTVIARNAREFPFTIRCKAKWDTLSLDEGE